MDPVANQHRDILDAYRAKPGLIREHFNGEDSDRKGYAGRPLLELIQNVEDALAEAEQQGNVLLELTDEMLTIANQGAPFSDRGFQALCDRNDSPKPCRQHFVGSKGTGFKAVLNWSDRPEIYSGAIAARFDRAEATPLILEAIGEEGRRRLNEDDVPWPDANMPVLRVPLPAMPDERVRQLLEQGWATIIRLRLLRQTAPKVAEQLRSLNPQDLLFLKHLREVTLLLDGEPLTWALHRNQHGQTYGVESHDLEVLKDGRTHATYRVLRRRLPDVRPKESNEVGDVEVALAYCTDAGDQAPASGVSNFFPTECRSPLPAIPIHGTFLLTSDRKYLRQDDPSYQHALIAALGVLCREHLIPELVERYGHRALNYLRPGPEVAGSPESVERALRERLVETVRSTPFVPTVSGRNAAPKDLRLLSHRLGDLLDGHPDAPDEPAFPAWCGPESAGLLEALGAAWLDPMGHVNALTGWRPRTADEACTAIGVVQGAWADTRWNEKDALLERARKLNLWRTVDGRFRSLVGSPPFFEHLPPDLRLPPFVRADELNGSFRELLKGKHLWEPTRDLRGEHLIPYGRDHLLGRALLPALAACRT